MYNVNFILGYLIPNIFHMQYFFDTSGRKFRSKHEVLHFLETGKKLKRNADDVVSEVCFNFNSDTNFTIPSLKYSTNLYLYIHKGMSCPC